MMELIPPLKPAAPLSVLANPPEVVDDNSLDQVLLDGGLRVAAREALPKLIGCDAPLVKPPTFETAESRTGVVLAVTLGSDARLGSPGNL
jgi:hypothetical protein